MRGYQTPEIIEKAVQKEKLFIPQAPGLGLVLDNVHYTRYNERYGSDGHHEALTFKDEEEAVEEFFRKNIMSTIIETELRDEPMKRWIGRLKVHEYEKVEGEKENSDKDGYDSD